VNLYNPTALNELSLEGGISEHSKDVLCFFDSKVESGAE
jgi:hypothetical protein